MNLLIVERIATVHQEDMGKNIATCETTLHGMSEKQVCILIRWTKKFPIRKWIESLNWLKLVFNYFVVMKTASYRFEENFRKKLMFFKMKNFENCDVLRAWEASK